MNIVSKKNLSASSFDQTIECEVVNIDEKDSGIYLVKSDEATFQAYATGTFTYYLHDIVYVTIPGGDYRRQKFIIGRKSDQSDASSVYNLKFPFDDFVKLQEINLNPAEEYGFRANAPEDNKILLGSATFTNPETGKEEPVAGMTRIGLELDVQTLLGGYYPISGEYGIQIDVTGIVGATKENAAYTITQTTLFTNKEMYGNSYAYYQFYNQQKIIDISAFVSVSQVDIYFVQGLDFYDEDGVQIPYAEIKAGSEAVSVPMPDNIFLRNINAYFGMESSELKEEKLFLYTYSPMYYNANLTGNTPEETAQKNLEQDTKQMFFNWVHIKDDNSGTILFKTSEQLKEFNEALLKSIMDKSKAEELTATESIEYDNRKLQVFWFKENLGLNTEFHASNAEGSIYSELAPKSLYIGPRWQVITADETLTHDAYYYDANFDPFEYTTNVNNGYSHQKYKVMIMFGSRRVISSELNFINYVKMDGGAPDITTENADMIFKCFTGYYDENEKYCVEYDDKSSVGRFYVYDENDDILMDINGRKYSTINYYLQLWRRPQVNASTNIPDEYSESVYVPLLYETEPFTATWNFFDRYTMINSAELNDEEVYAFAEHQARLNEENKVDEADKELIRKVTKKFTIREKLDSQYKNNEVTAIVEQGHIKYYAHKDFQFGRASSQGSKYTVSIVINDNKDTYVTEDKNTTLSCQIYDINNNLTNAASYTWHLINEYDKETCPTGCEIILVEPDVTPWNHVDLNIKWPLKRSDGTDNAAPAFEVIVDGVEGCDYELSTKRGLMVGPANLNELVIIVPERIEYKSDGTVPYYYKKVFSVLKVDDDTLVYPTWEEGQHAGEYPFIEIVENNIEGYSVDTGEIAADGSETSVPVISKHNEYSLIVHDGYMWKQEYANGVFELINDIGVRQAIVQAQNVYPSSLVNSWDGTTLSIDEKTNSVLANRVAAGTKTNNRFTGVMMGDWKPYGDESVELIGIYGFQDGQQTFGFMEDGTGFIGGQQTGRITFDGKNAMISNFDKTCYINLNPAVVKTEDNNNNTSQSQYFLYSEVQRTNEDDNNLHLTWATKFFEDSSKNQKDYFIVDPTRGVLTTGGVIARYGYIGEWLINKGGLSWYSDLTNKNISDIIYLGDWENNPYKDHVTNTNNPPASAGHTYLISAGTGESGSQIMNFGVTADGYLFSQSGRVGGWSIKENTLESVKANEIKDSEGNIIARVPAVILDGQNGTATFGVIDSNGVMQGNIYIAGFEFLSNTKSAIQYPSEYNINNQSTSTETIDDSVTLWGGSYSASLTIESVNGIPTITESQVNVTNNLAILDITNTITQNQGVNISTGYAENENDQNVHVIVYPTTTNNQATLGTLEHKWNIYGHIAKLDSASIATLNSSFIYMGNNLVATQLWVSQQLKKVYDKIKAAATAASNASYKAQQAIKNSNTAINRLAEMAGKIADPIFVTDIAIEAGKMTFNSIKFTWSWSGVSEDSAGSGSSGSSAQGARTFVFYGSTIPMVSGGNTIKTEFEALEKRVAALESHTHKLKGESVLSHTHGLSASANLETGSVSGSATSRALNVTGISTGGPL